MLIFLLCGSAAGGPFWSLFLAAPSCLPSYPRVGYINYFLEQSWKWILKGKKSSDEGREADSPKVVTVTHLMEKPGWNIA